MAVMSTGTVQVPAHASQPCGVGAPTAVPSRVSRWAPLCLIALSSVGFSIQALVVRTLTTAGVPTFEVLMIRGSCQAVLCIATMLFKGMPLRSCLGKSWVERGWLMVRGVVGFCGVAFAFLAISLLPLAESQVLGQTVPMFAASYAWGCLGERWHVSEFTSAVGALVGVVFISRPGLLVGKNSTTVVEAHSDSRMEHMLGVACGLAAAALSGGAYVIIRLLGTRVKVEWIVILFFQGVCQVLFCPPCFFRLWPDIEVSIQLAVCFGARLRFSWIRLAGGDDFWNAAREVGDGVDCPPRHIADVGTFVAGTIFARRSVVLDHVCRFFHNFRCFDHHRRRKITA